MASTLPSASRIAAADGNGSEKVPSRTCHHIHRDDQSQLKVCGQSGGTIAELAPHLSRIAAAYGKTNVEGGNQRDVQCGGIAQTTTLHRQNEF